MPLLRKKPFQRLHVSSDFREDDEVFHCAVTNEIFKDYNEFCERIILCNSMIWSCSITGKSGMTYEEALQCEEHAKESLKEFPMELRIPILYLTSKTSRTSFNEMMEDVFQYARERYFIGEMVEASFTEETWCECHILQVIEPSAAQISAYNAENKNSQDRQYQPPAKLFRYEVEQLDSGDSDVSEIMIVEASQIRRRKQQYTRERNKIFLRMLCEQSNTGVWIVKENVLQKYGINKIRWDSIFAGPLPDFTPKPKKVVRLKQESIAKFLTSDPSKHRAFEKPDPLKKVNDSGMVNKKYRKPRLNGKFKEELKAKALEEKAKRKEERTQQSLEKKERKKALALYIKKWSKPRDDLEVEDLKPLPQAVPVKDALLNSKFGEFAMILEFLQFFYDEIEVKTYFPNGLNLEMLQKAMLDKEVTGTLNDLIQLLLANIFKYQAEEEDEIEAEPSEDIKENNINIDHKVSSMAEAVKLATMASTWAQTHQGCQLSDLALDYYSMSEILRQHLLSSGGRISEAASKWRYSQRGGYTNHDDPALLFRIEKPRILRVLSHRNVCELDLEDRLTVIICLMNQLLTFASIRDVIDERYEKLFQAKKELRSFIAAEQKREREEKEKLKEKEKEGINVEEVEPELKKITRSNCKEEKRKEDYEEKLKELQLASRDDQMMVLLGYDRAYRKYWRLLSIPGVFVENSDPYFGTCLPEGTPYMPDLADPDVLYSYLKSKFEDECSDKENNAKKVKSPKKSLADKTGMKALSKDRKELLKNLMACTGNGECPVHIKRPSPNWSFYGNEQDIDNLINSLNEKGIREQELRNNLIHDKESIVAAINNCQKYKFNPDIFTESPKDTTKSIKKTKNDIAVNYPSDLGIDNILELNLRDYILDLEDKIKVGCIGSLKVENRDAWRLAIHNNKYDKQCDKLYYGSSEIPVDFCINAAVDKIKTESKNSRPGTPDSEHGSSTIKLYRDPGQYLGPPEKNEPAPIPNQQKSIKQMACAILQVYQSIEHKYLKKPLGDDKDKKYSCEEARDKWEQSLMASTSWAQLFVHLNTLDNSIAWSRSATNAQCRICRKRRDAENMLLCDGCNKGHHLYCLKPKLSAVPEGDWFCIACKPKENKSKEKSKKRRKFEDEVEEEPLFTKETRHTRAKKIVESDMDDEAENHGEESEQETALCSVCESDGKLISCDTCLKSFHIDCLEPPLTRTPRGRWTCSNCKTRKSNSSRAVVKGREKDRESERSSAATARSRIHGFAKSLLSKESKDYDSSASDEAEQPRQTRRSAKRAAEIVHEEEEKLHIKFYKSSVQELLLDIKRHRDSWPFMTPVTTDEVPDYYDYISEPMDFGTIKKKFEDDEYQTLNQFFRDCLLVFDNCQTYNTENSPVYKAGIRLLKFLEKRCKELNLNFNEDSIRQPPSKSQKLQRNGEQNGVSHSDEDNDSNDS